MTGPQAFNVVFENAIQKTVPADEVKQRVINLTDEITYSVYMYTARGLFERDKLIFLAQVTFQVTAVSAPALVAPRLVLGVQTLRTPLWCVHTSSTLLGSLGGHVCQRADTPGEYLKVLVQLAKQPVSAGHIV